MKEKLKKLAASLFGWALTAGIILGIVAVIAVFSGTVMRIFGFEYRSVWSIILYFLISAAAGFPLEVFASALPLALVSLEAVRERTGVWLFIILDTAATAVSMAVIDYFMDSVSASDPAILAVALIFSLTSIKDFKEKVKQKHKEQ